MSNIYLSYSCYFVILYLIYLYIKVKTFNYFSCDVSNRLSRESSQDILVEDLDRLSTTSAMSESSVSHRLNDVQDVQDIARMQEESKLALFFILFNNYHSLLCLTYLLLCCRSEAFHTIEKPAIR